MAIAEIVGLGFFALQQLGVALGVGGETVALLSRGNPALASAARRATAWGLWAVIISGVFITAAHILAGEGAIVGEPAYLFKWLVVIVLLVGSFMARGVAHVILVGGSWYALFLVHTLAPVTTMPLLLILYAGWMILFAAASLMFNRKSVPEPVHVPEIAKPQVSGISAYAAVPAAHAIPEPVRMTPAPPPPTPRAVPPSFPVRPTPSPSPLPPPLQVRPSEPQPPRASLVPSNLPTMQTEPRRTLGLPQVVPPVKTMLDAAAVDKGGLSASALQSIPTALPDKDTEPLSAVSVMPRNPNDLKKSS